mmetsp:Transcript_49313/g.123631  ORF Transcript_49313/g.123631 Transcript_49313/m.123631 type:complete len:85 (+) Transcript_49313:789-1043(+)
MSLCDWGSDAAEAIGERQLLRWRTRQHGDRDPTSVLFCRKPPMDYLSILIPLSDGALSPLPILVRPGMGSQPCSVIYHLLRAPR